MARLTQIPAGRDSSGVSTTGIDVRSTIIPGENPAELAALVESYGAQFRPAGPVESYLVDTLIQADWNRRRYSRAEAQLLATVITHPDVPRECPLGAVFAQDGNHALRDLARRLDAAERSYFRALKELRHIQAGRQPEDPAPREAQSPRPQPSRTPDLRAVARGGDGLRAAAPAVEREPAADRGRAASPPGPRARVTSL